jgi:hypothetical protein
VAENDDWSRDAPASLTEAGSASAGAFALTAGSRDAAVFVQLPPGSYTANLTGKDGAEGVGLVEVYHIR